MRPAWVLASCLVVCSSGAPLRVGAAKKVITPDLATSGPVYLAGFGQNRVATRVHDDLYTRCMAFSTGARPLVICAVDAIGLFYDDVKQVRAKATDADIVVVSTHNHETPDTMGLWGAAPGKSGINEAYNARVIARTAEAALEAVRSLKPARLRIGKVSAPELDALIHDTRPPVRHDSELVALIAETNGGVPIGTLVNWSNHPEALDSKNTEITADYLAYFHPVLERKFGGVSVFCNGAVGGMQSPLGATVVDPETKQPARAGTFRFAELVGSRAGEFAVRALAQASVVEVETVAFRETLIQIPMANVDFQMAAKAGVFGGRKAPSPDMKSATPVGYIRFGGRKNTPVLEIALIPGEMYPELSVGGIERYAGADYPDAPLETPIKQQMKAPFRMLFGLASDEIGYILPKSEWDSQAPWLQNAPKRWYGEVNSLGPDAAPLIAVGFRTLIDRSGN